MTDVNNLITDNIDVWTSAIKKRNAVGRGSSNKLGLSGIKKLRELILELAVRGKLVPQDINDEPALVLLEKIAEEIAQLIAEKKVKKPKPLPVITDDSKPYKLPIGWSYSRLGDFVSIIRGITFPGSEKHKEPADERVACLRTANVQHNIDWDDLLYINKAFVKRDEQYLVKGDIVMSMANSRELVGKVSFTESIPTGTASFGGFLSVIRPYQLSAGFLMCVLRAPHIKNSLIGSASQTTNIANISLEKLYPLLVALPPLAEQHRIAVKVDELMALCDQLEQQTEESLSAHQTLVEVLLATLTESKSAEDFQSSWQRIAEHFDLLFTTEHSIEQLKQTILQLAVMGKLVPQNPSDEPANVLLEKIAEEKALLIADKKIKKQKPLPEITDEEKPFELPKAWEWCYLENTALTSEAGWSPRCLPTARENEKWGVLKVSAVTWGVFNPDENKELPSSLDPRPQYEVHSGDFLISRANTAELVARAVIVPTDAPKKLMMSDKIIRFVLSPRVEGAYISLVNNSRFSRSYYAEVAGGTSSSMKNVSREHIRSLVIALPPITEQNRIITKVDELIALCEQLKARLSDVQTTQLHLAAAVVEQALN